MIYVVAEVARNIKIAVESKKINDFDFFQIKTGKTN